MRARIVVGGALFVIIGVGAAFSQAIAESALLHANSAAAAAKAGSALGDSLNKMTGSLAGQMRAISQPKGAGEVHATPQTRRTSSVVLSKPKSAPAGSAPAGSRPSGTMITSIRGARQSCSAATSQTDCALKPQTQTQMKSVINLPPAQ